MEMVLDQESGVLKFAVYHDASSWFRWLQQQRRRVARCLNCSIPVFTSEFSDGRFNNTVLVFFWVALVWTIINIFLYMNIQLDHVQTGIIVVELCAAALFFSVLVKTMKDTVRASAAAPQRTGEVRSVSSLLVQHV